MLREWEVHLIVDLSEHFRIAAVEKASQPPPLTMQTMDQILDSLA